MPRHRRHHHGLPPCRDGLLSDAARAQCAVHADREAARSCERCGNFACAECLGEPAAVGGRFCAACRARGEIGHVAWEGAGPFWERYVATCRAAIIEPRATFAAVGTGGLGRPAVFAAISSFVGLSPFLLCIPFVFLALLDRTPAFDPAMFAAIPCAFVFYPALSFAYFTSIGLVFHALAVVLGGRATLAESMRAGWYSSAWEPVSAVTMVLLCVPLLNFFFIVGTAATSAVWRGFALRSFAERSHGLSPSRALWVAALTSGFWLTLWLALFGGVVGFAVYQRFRGH